jgi:hypothetical protein
VTYDHQPTLAPVAHRPDCPTACRRDVPLTTTADAAKVWAKLHHCMSVAIWTGPEVRLEWQVIPEHAYQESMLWPARQPRALCADCRSTAKHKGES